MSEKSVRFSLSKDASTSLKGLACLLIVLHHWCSGLSGAGYDGSLVELFTQAGGITGVAVFFFLSSYGLSRSQQKKKDTLTSFFAKRLVRVYIPLVITNVLWLSLRYEGQELVQAIFQILNLKDLLDIVTWFCNVIIVCYIIFYVSNSLASIWAKLLCNWTLTIALAVLLSMIWPKYPCYVYSLIAFPLGATVGILQDKMNWSNLLATTFVPSMTFLGILVWCLPGIRNLVVANLYCCVIILCLMFIVMWVQHSESSVLTGVVGLSAKPLSFIGLYSYEIYLLHNKLLMLHSEYHVTIWYPITFLLIVLPLAVILYMCDQQVTKLMVKK
jgi:peptidoglycan/LPS O-acetylase OafA/YrhL